MKKAPKKQKNGRKVPLAGMFIAYSAIKIIAI
jgi:hypothetical protein